MMVPLASQDTFTKVITGPVVEDGGTSISASWGDYDNDGDLDLFVANPDNYNNFLYTNNGDGTFTKVTTGSVVTDGGNSQDASWGDYDNDSDLDLFVANFGANNFIYTNNGDGTFTKVTTGSVVTDGGDSQGASWGDYDNDGDLDLFVANHNGQNNFLYINNGDGTFTVVTTGSVVTDGGDSQGASWGDYDNDGDLDLFVANHNSQNDFLYTNNGNGTFSKVTSGPPVSNGGDGRDASWGDYDNDGDLDLFVANDKEDDFFYNNNGDGTFTELTTLTLVSDGGNSFGTSWGDYDNDGDLDLFVARIHNQTNFLYANNGDGTFTKITTGPVVGEAGTSLGAAWGDYDNDGDLDLFVANGDSQNNFLYSNNGNANHWINLKLVGIESNTSAIGVKVRLKATISGTTVWQLREVSGHTGSSSQNSLNVEFGLGDATIIDSIQVRWPSGNQWDTANVAVDQFLTVREPVVDNGLVAYYPFNGNANDESGNGFDGEIHGPSLTPDRFGNANSAYNFDGLDDYILLPDLDPITDFSITGWFKTGDAQLARFVDKDNGFNQDEFSITIDSYGRLYSVYELHGNSVITLFASDTINDDQWHQFAVINDSNCYSLYFDGVLDTSANHELDTFDNDTQFCLGYSMLEGTTVDYYEGFLDDIYIYNKAISANGVDSLFQIGGWPPPEAPNNLSAIPENQQTTLSWTPNSESDLAKYRIYRDTSSPATTLVDSVVGAPPDTFYTDTGLTNGQTYYYRITAVDSYGNESDFSEEAFATPVETGTVTDIDGNTYRTVKISDQWWMAENLKVTHYSNGEVITKLPNATVWSSSTDGAYCNYDNNDDNAEVYGSLYNWYAINDSRSVAPDGWHVPTDDDWKELEMFLGMEQSSADAIEWRGTDEGGKLKEIGNIHWNSPNTGATNESGFTAIASGYRQWSGEYIDMGVYSNYWSGTEWDSYYAMSRSLFYNNAEIWRGSSYKNCGFSVRCVKDSQIPADTTLFTVRTDGSGDYTVIQTAIDGTNDGDTVLVFPGTYVENINFNGKNIVVGSLYILSQDTGYISSTVINGNNSGSVVSFVSGEDTTAQLSGFTITNGNGTIVSGVQRFGGGIYCYDSSQPTISNCIIESNSAGAGSGGGIACWYASAIIENCIIRNNSNHGIANMFGAEARVVNCLIHDNYGSDYGGGIKAGGGSIPILINCTITDNNSYHQVGSGIYAISGVSVVNSIVWNNVGTNLNLEESATSITYSCIGGGHAGTGNIDSDPLFVDASTDDFHLSDLSPCIGAGTLSNAPSNDIAGNPRPDPPGSNPDMGAYENALAAPQYYQVFHVSTTGNDINDGSADHPYRNIATALLVADHHDTIKVAQGSYSEGLIPQAAVVLLGGYGPDFSTSGRNIAANQTVIRAVSTTILTDNEGCTVDGFFFHGNGVAELGIDVNDSTVFTHNIVAYCTQSAGHGLEITGPAKIYNNVIHGNLRGLYLWGSAAEQSRVRNNIVTNNSFGINNSAASGIHQYNDFYNNAFNYAGTYDTPGVGDISLNPLYVDAANDDFRIQSTSPCIDAGDPDLDDDGAYWMTDPDDRDPDGTRLDMGAFFYLDLPPDIPTGLTAQAANSRVSLTWNANVESDLAKYQIYRDSVSPATTLIGSVTGTPPDTVFTDSSLTNDQIYFYCITAVDQGDNESGFSTEVTTTPDTMLYAVKTDGSGNFTKIQEAINATADGDTVLVHPGTYVENINFNGKNIVVGSLFLTTQDTSYISSTIIDGNQSGSVVIFESGEDSTSEIIGLTIQNGHASHGGGIYLDNSNPKIIKCFIENNSVTNDGAGIFCYNNSNPSISRCVIRRNLAESNGGNGGGLMISTDSRPIIVNSIISNNTADQNGGGFCISNQCSPSIINCTIVHNSAYSGGGIWWNMSTLYMLNSIVWWNGIEQIYPVDTGGHVANSNIQGGHAGLNNININPIFIDTLNHNYSLSDFSPCIGAGEDSIQIDGNWYYASVTDFDGNPRPNPAGSIPDIGAYENPLSSPLIPPAPTNLEAEVGNSEVVLSWTGNKYSTSYSIYYSTTSGSNYLSQSNVADTVYTFFGLWNDITYYFVVTAVGAGGESGYSSEVDATPHGQLYTVKTDSTGDYSNIQEAIDASLNDDTVLVFPGTYIENINFNGRKIVVGSLFLTDQDTTYISSTIIDGNQEGSVVQFYLTEDTTSVLTGFTLQNGKKDHGGGIHINNATSPQLNNLVVRNNVSTGDGGGLCIYAGSNCIIKNLKVINNSSTGSGGGLCIHAGSNCIIKNLKVINNSSTGSGGGICSRENHTCFENVLIVKNTASTDGGGASFYGDVPHLVNVTISDNVAGERGGGIFCNDFASIELVNTILWNNSPQEIFILSGNVISSYSCIEGGYTGTEIISSDPLFVDASADDYHLSDLSPCIGAGTLSNAPSNDIAGNPRPNPPGSNPDIGAYENPLGSPENRILTIAEARQMAVDDTVMIKGIITSPSYNTANLYCFIQDSTAALRIWYSGNPDIQMGDSVIMTGIINEYYTLQITPTNDSDIILINRGNTLPEPQVISITEFETNHATYESELIRLDYLNIISGGWPDSGSSAILDITDGIDSTLLKIDSDLDIAGQSEPPNGFSLIGCAAAASSGYEIWPRMYSDFIYETRPNPTRLYFSEYIEGSGSNKALEIFNASDTLAYLKDYKIAGCANGCEKNQWEYWYSFPDTAILQPDSVFVFVYQGADVLLTDEADAIDIYTVAVNGNDTRGLLRIVNEDTVLLDIIGERSDVVPESGQGWAVAGVADATVNHTLIRKNTIERGNINWTESAGTNEIDSEWLVYPIDYFDNLGEHRTIILPDGPVWYVDTSGTDSYVNGSQSNPVKTIQYAIDRTANGDTVLVYPGTYVENINFNGKNIVVGSLFLTTQDTLYISSTIIDGNQNGSVVTFESGEDSSAIITGLTIQNGSGTYLDFNYGGNRGGGILVVNSLPTIQNCIIQDNIVSGNNGAGAGILLYDGSDPQISNCIIRNNTAREHGAGIALFDNCDPIIENCLFYGDSARYGGGIYSYNNSVPQVRNCTFYGNTAADYGGAVVARDATLSLLNSILWDNVAPNGNEIALYEETTTTTVSVHYCDINGGEAGVYDVTGSAEDNWYSGNIDLNPGFENEAIHDFRLKDYSLCIGAGTVAEAPATDIAGSLRPDPPGSNPDMGAYENPLAEPEPILITLQVDMSIWDISPLGVFVAGDFNGWQPDSGLMGDDNSDQIYSYTIDGLYIGDSINYQYLNGEEWEATGYWDSSCRPDGHNHRYYVTNGTDTLDPVCFKYCSQCSEIELLTLLHISSSGDDVSGDGSIGNPFATIQHGIDVCNNGDTVLVHPGTYVENINFNGKNIVVGSLFLTTQDTSYISSTIIDGNQSGTVIKTHNELLASMNVEICGLTIQNGLNANGGSGVDIDISNTLLDHLIIKECNNGLRGGVSCNRCQDLVITDCVIKDNDGGTSEASAIAIFASTAIISNTLIYNNISAGDGVVAINGSVCTIINSTILNNSVLDNRACIFSRLGSSINLINTIIVNHPANLYVWEGDDEIGSINIYNSNVSSGVNSLILNDKAVLNWGDNNIIIDPLFIASSEEYQLSNYSPCIGAGIDSILISDTWYYAPNNDFASNPRPNPIGSNPDIGAYESPLASRLPQATGAIYDGLSGDIDWSKSATEVAAHWDHFEDDSQVTYECAIGNSQSNPNTEYLDWTSVGTDTFIVLTGLNFSHGQQYFVSVRATDIHNQISDTLTSDGVRVDLSEPLVGLVWDGTANGDVDWAGPNEYPIYWTGSDTRTITNYQYSLSTAPGDSDVVDWTDNGGATSVTVTGLSLTRGNTYYANVRAEDTAGNLSAVVSSDGVSIDDTSPVAGQIFDDLNGNGRYHAKTDSLEFYWTGFSDAHSGIDHYLLALGTSAGANDVVDWFVVPSGTAYGLSGMSLADNQVYYATVKAVDVAGLESSPVSTDGIIIDVSGPVAGTVNDGNNADIDWSNEEGSITTNWTGFSDAGCGLNYYQCSVGTQPLDISILPWTDTEYTSHTYASYINLVEGNTYYWNVRAVDSLGNVSAIASSDGVALDWTAPEVTSTTPGDYSFITPGQATTIVFELSEELVYYTEDIVTTSGTVFGDQYEYYSSPPRIEIIDDDHPVFGDTLVITINQLEDLSGLAGEPYSITLYTPLLADYNNDRAIDVIDLSEFATFWNDDSYMQDGKSVELGPLTGTAPYFTLTPDNRYNLQDLMGFTMMWNWYRQQVGPATIFASGETGDQPIIEQFGKQLVLQVLTGARSGQVWIAYPNNIAEIRLVTFETGLNRLQLQDNDLELRQLLVEYADLDSVGTGCLQFQVATQSKENARLTVNYSFYNNKQEMVSSGSQEIELVAVPDKYALHQNYPNPFNPVTTINYDLPEDVRVKLTIHDIMGRQVAQLVNEEQQAGYKAVQWSGKNSAGQLVSAGMYFCTIEAGDYSAVRKMVLLK